MMDEGARAGEWALQDRPFLLAGRQAVPAVTADETAEMDRIMTEELGIALVQMMEGAGSALASLAVRMAAEPSKGPFVVLAGGGGNGGGALVAARRLAGWGHAVEVVTAFGRASRATGLQLGILRRMGVSIRGTDEAALFFGGTQRNPPLVIDGLIGYRLEGGPRGASAHLIRLLRRSDVRVLSLDIPSGLEPTTGAAGPLTVVAEATLAVALPKTGTVVPSAARWVGRLYLADIGVPQAVLDRLGLPAAVAFRGRRVIRLRRAGEHAEYRPEGAGET